MEDRDLIQRIRQGESSSITFLVKKYESKVLTVCYYMVKDQGVAEELTQDAFLKALNNLEKLDNTDKFGAWLHRLAYNICIDFLRKKDIEKVDITKADAIAEGSADAFIEKEKSELVRAGIMKLKTEDRAVVSLFYLDELPIKEIAEILDMTESNVKVRLFRARIELQKILKPIFHLWTNT